MRIHAQPCIVKMEESAEKIEESADETEEVSDEAEKVADEIEAIAIGSANTYKDSSTISV